MIIEWSTEDYTDNPYEAWRHDIMQSNDAPWAVGAEPIGTFAASHKILALNDLVLEKTIFFGATGHRGRREIKASGLEKYTCVVVAEGSQGILQDAFDCRVVAGDIYLWDSERPCAFDSSEGATLFDLAIPKDNIHQLTGGEILSPNIIDGTSGMGAMLAQFLMTAVTNADDFVSDDNDTVNGMLTKLVVRNFWKPDSVKYSAPKRLMLNRLHRYIAIHISDPLLSPATVAKANGISVRYLHLLFAQSTCTFTMYVNKSRVAKVKLELRSRTVSDVTLTQLAFHCGFNSSAQFSRVFRRVSGQTARSYKKKFITTRH